MEDRNPERLEEQSFVYLSLPKKSLVFIRGNYKNESIFMTYPNSLDEPHAWGTTRQFYLFVSTEIQSHFSQSIISVISVISVISKVNYVTLDLNTVNVA